MVRRGVQRKLTAVPSVGVAGYGRLTGDAEEGTHRRRAAGLEFIAALRRLGLPG